MVELLAFVYHQRNEEQTTVYFLALEEIFCIIREDKNTGT